MNDASTNTGERGVTVGLDLGDTYTQLCTIDGDGELIEEARLRTTPTALRRRFSAMAASLVWSSKLAPTRPGSVVSSRTAVMRSTWRIPASCASSTRTTPRATAWTRSIWPVSVVSTPLCLPPSATVAPPPRLISP